MQHFCADTTILKKKKKMGAKWPKQKNLWSKMSLIDQLCKTWATTLAQPKTLVGQISVLHLVS